jgi:hypothetical protein
MQFVSVVARYASGCSLTCRVNAQLGTEVRAIRVGELTVHHLALLISNLA